MAIKLGELTLFDVQELAKKFHVNPITVRRYMKSGRLKGRKVGRKWYLTEEALRGYFHSIGNPPLMSVNNTYRTLKKKP